MASGRCYNWDEWWECQSRNFLTKLKLRPCTKTTFAWNYGTVVSFFFASPQSYESSSAIAFLQIHGTCWHSRSHHHALIHAYKIFFLSFTDYINLSEKGIMHQRMRWLYCFQPSEELGGLTFIPSNPSTCVSNLWPKLFISTGPWHWILSKETSDYYYEFQTPNKRPSATVLFHAQNLERLFTPQRQLSVLQHHITSTQAFTIFQRDPYTDYWTNQKTQLRWFTVHSLCKARSA